MTGDRELEIAADAAPIDTADDLHPEESVIVTIRQALREIEYGSIFIKIHQGRVVGLETSTKVRLDQ